MIHAIPLPSLPQLKAKGKDTASVQIDGCYPGYGITLANALRRVLLSSLPGTAITAFKIKGIDHEFSTIPYVLEDVVRISLNLKKVRFASKNKFFDEPVTATLKVKGEKEVTAKDIKTPAGIEIVNKDLHIATITDKKGELDIELFLMSGYGYEQAEERHKEKLPIGTIAIDSIYSPVLRVNYQIEDMRIGKRTDFNRIIMDIITDNSIDALSAFKEACSILEKQFAHLAGVRTQKAGKATFKKTAKTSGNRKTTSTTKKTKTASPKKLTDLGLDTKIIRLLEENGIKSVAGLVRKKESSLSELKGIGKAALKQIQKKLSAAGLSLKE